MDILIIGYGYVGKAFADFFSVKFHTVHIYDTNFCENDTRYVKTIKEYDLYVVCVPTNKNPEGFVNLEAINETFEKINAIKRDAFVLIKSTVPPLTTKKLSKKYPEMKIVFSPEYIGESSYYLGAPYNWNKEVIKTPFFIFGGNKEYTSILVDIFQAIAGPNKQYYQSTSTEAEITKYMENSFFAAKIIFCNEFYNICKVYGADYNTVRELWLADIRINKNHTIILNKDKPYCFGGKCLPKDLAGIYNHSKKQGYNSRFLKAVLESNFKTTGVLMFHRIAFSDKKIDSIYYARKLVTTKFELEKIIQDKLNAGKKFGSLDQSFANPDKYFTLTFDDGYVEHLETSKWLKEKFNCPKDSMIFSICTDFIQCKSYGMDLIYSLVDAGKIKDVFDFFNLRYESNISVLEQVQLLKNEFVTSTPEKIVDFAKSFYSYLPKNQFLTEIQLKELSSISTIACHGKTHRNLTYHKDFLEKELFESKNILENICESMINIFCYPEGKKDDFVKSKVSQMFDYGIAINGDDSRYSVSRTNGSCF